MPTDHQRVLLAVLKARGPAHPADLAHHPVIREHYRPFAHRFYVRDDLEELVDVGEVDAHTVAVDGESVTVAYDVVGVDRAEVDARMQRAEAVVREHRRRRARRERTGVD